MNFNTLRFRIILTFTPIILAGFTGLALLVGSQIRTAAAEDFAQRAEEQVALIARGLESPLEHLLEGEQTPSALEDTVKTYVQQTGGDVLLLSAAGQLIAGSAELLPTGSLLEQNEIQAALTGQVTHEIRPNADAEATLYTAAPVIHDGSTLGIVSLALPRSGIDTVIRQRWLGLIAGIATLTVITLLLSILLAISLTRPVEQLRQSALRLAEGDFSTPLPETRQDEFGELARTFNYMRRQVQAMLEEQRSFASNAAHELRTPLTTIHLRTEALLADPSDSARTEQYIGEINSEVERLAGLVDDLTLLSRIDAGRFEPGKEQIQPERFVTHLVREFEARFRAKSQRFELEVLEPLVPIEVSLNHLHVVFRNLLDNAHKYSPPDETITWKIWQEENRLMSAIADTGRGISPEVQANLFKRFYRGDESRSRLVPGTGLGLALCKSIVEAYGGSLLVASDGPDKGTTITVSWPVASNDLPGTDSGNPR